ncbi:28272_t:CDS:2, partial [Dentiscutata erythropus]
SPSWRKLTTLRGFWKKDDRYGALQKRSVAFEGSVAGLVQELLERAECLMDNSRAVSSLPGMAGGLRKSSKNIDLLGGSGKRA